MELGFTIKKIRKSLKLTQKDLCCDILNRSTMCKIENNQIVPSLAQLDHISKVLNTPIEKLMNPSQETPVEAMTPDEKNINIKTLFEKGKYLDIIEAPMKPSFEIYFYKGMSYYYENLMDKAYNYLLQCEPYFFQMNEVDKFRNAEKLCISLNSLRKCNLDSFSDQNNIKLLKKILDYINCYNCKKYEIYDIIINNIGVYYMDKNEYKTALNFMDDYLTTKTKPHYLNVTAIIHLNMSITCFSMRYYEKATDHIKKAIFFFNYVGKLEDEEECYINLVNCYLYTRRFEECKSLINYLKERYIGSKLYNTFKILEVTLYYNWDDRELFFKSVDNLNYSDLRNKSRMDYYFLKGKCCFIQGDYTKSQKNYNKCISYLLDNKRYLDASVVYKDLSQIDETMNYSEEYENALTKFHELEYTPSLPDITVPDADYLLSLEEENYESDRL